MRHKDGNKCGTFTGRFPLPPRESHENFRAARYSYPRPRAALLPLLLTQRGDMSKILLDIGEFKARKACLGADAVQRVALQLLCGLDLTSVFAADDPCRRAALKRIERMVVRERLKGLSRHWSYDLNRHIALKQACDRLRDSLGQVLAKKTTAPRGRRRSVRKAPAEA